MPNQTEIERSSPVDVRPIIWRLPYFKNINIFLVFHSYFVIFVTLYNERKFLVDIYKYLLEALFFTGRFSLSTWQMQANVPPWQKFLSRNRLTSDVQ